MAAIAQEQIGDPYANFLARRYLEWPLAVYPVNQELFHMVGYKNGSLPGILTTVYYASPRVRAGWWWWPSSSATCPRPPTGNGAAR
jgi:hypothetical protein